ncbi:MAG: phosphoserine phosphatase SerB [Alphaproteobacteria bacterium]
MQHAIVFSTSQPKKSLTNNIIERLLIDHGQEIAGTGIAEQNIEWLQPDHAAQIMVSTNAHSSLAGLRAAADGIGIDVNMVATNNRRKKLLIADMDSTIITDESLDEMAARVGIGAAVAEITARSMNGELNFEEALEARVAMLAGKPATLFDDTLAATQLIDGAQILVRTMRNHGAKCYIVSGGFMPIATPVAESCGFHAAHANDMDIAEGQIVGTVKKPILGRNAKAEIMADYCQQLQLHSDDVAAIGDGANDLAMLQIAGMGVAFRGKPLLRNAISLQLNHTDLTGLLFLQGYKVTDFSN